jgi:hypothetical protein
MASTVLHIFCDESRQSKDRYMVLGGIIIPKENIPAFNATMANYRARYNMHSELKWSKVKQQKIEEYKGFIDYFIALSNTNKIHFKSIVVDNHLVNHKKYNSGDKELGFYKFYYQLILHCFGVKYYKKESDVKFIIHPDELSSKYPLEELKKILNNGISKKLGVSINPFVSIEPKCSHDSEIAQINDLIIGAIGYEKNGYHLLAGSASGKIELLNYIKQSAGIATLCDTTPIHLSRFGIWNFRLNKK